jgi:hypothetical protein
MMRCIRCTIILMPLSVLPLAADKPLGVIGSFRRLFPPHSFKIIKPRRLCTAGFPPSMTGHSWAVR